MENSELLVILAKSMKLQEIASGLSKSSSILTKDLIDRKTEPNAKDLSAFKPFLDCMTYCQLFITKLAYEGKDIVSALEDVSVFKKEFDMKREVAEIRKKDTN